MARVTSSVTKRNRHKKVLKEAKGYFGHKHRGYKSAKEQVRKSKEYAFRDRKNRKREFRKLWIKRINIAARQYDTSYSLLISGLNKANIEINRKMLADLAVNDIEQFGVIVNEARKALGLEPAKRNVVVPTNTSKIEGKQDKDNKEVKKEEQKVQAKNNEKKVEPKENSPKAEGKKEAPKKEEKEAKNEKKG